MFLLFLCACLNLSPVRDKLLVAEGALTVIRKEKSAVFRLCLQCPHSLKVIELCSENKVMRNESNNILFCSGVLQGADALEKKVSFHFEALQNRAILSSI